MGSEPILDQLICRNCGKAWNAFFPNGRESGDAECPSCGKMSGVENTLEERYFQLILCVGNRFEGETRHQTALRYLKNAEVSSNGPVCDGKTDGK